MGKLQKEKNRKKNNGITLIALVITIIVLLILAGVTIATLTGDNGILTKTSEASEKTKEANAKEQVQIAVTGSIGTDGRLENGSLKDNLNQIENISGVPEEITDGSYPLTVTVDGEYSYVINKDGTIGEVVTREGIQVGDYVNYTYDTKAEGYNLKATESGSIRDETISQETGKKWRILNIHPDGRVDLIGDISSSDRTVSFKGALGYNNGVYLLNDICKELYSNSTLGVEARGIDLEDIESQMNEEGIVVRDAYTNVVKYGETKTYTGSYGNYPNLYAQENGSGINTETVKTDGIEVSEEGYTSPTEETSSKADSLTVTQSYYNFSSTPNLYFNDSEVYDMIFGTGTYYWLGSRFARCNSIYADFGLHYVGNSNLYGETIFYSDGDSSGEYFRVRPVVSLGSDIEITACEGENSSTNMHQISK